MAKTQTLNSFTPKVKNGKSKAKKKLNKKENKKTYKGQGR